MDREWGRCEHVTSSSEKVRDVSKWKYFLNICILYYHTFQLILKVRTFSMRNITAVDLEVTIRGGGGGGGVEGGISYFVHHMDTTYILHLHEQPLSVAASVVCALFPPLRAPPLPHHSRPSRLPVEHVAVTSPRHRRFLIHRRLTTRPTLLVLVSVDASLL